MNAVLETRARRPIRELPGELVSQIAAGEVVERPASIVRELVDNALDAGARTITLRLAGGGIRALAVEDDGDGIAADELPLAVRRHATSKIATLAELEGVATMGFRGEALAAIASVAELSILSRTGAAPHATRLDARTGEIAPAARAAGTSVEVREVFFNTPARRKFLKTEATELAHCVEAVRRHALARPAVSFAIWHDGRLIHRWPAAAAARRIDDILGESFAAESRPVAVDLGGLRLAGRAGLPQAARGRADHQYVYVNGRHVRDKLVGHAIRAAYEDVLHGGRHPAYLLFIEVAAERVDVNVHPTKIEVRFRDSREIHEAVRRTFEAALAQPRAGASEGAGPAATAPVDAGPAPEAARQSRFDAALGAFVRVAEPLPDYRERPAAGNVGGDADASAGASADGRASAPGDAPLGRALAQVAGAFVIAENDAGPGHRRHARGARTNRLRAPEGEPRRRRAGAAAAPDSGRLRRLGSRDRDRGGARRCAARPRPRDDAARHRLARRAYGSRRARRRRRRRAGAHRARRAGAGRQQRRRRAGARRAAVDDGLPRRGAREPAAHARRDGCPAARRWSAPSARTSATTAGRRGVRSRAGSSTSCSGEDARPRPMATLKLKARGDGAARPREPGRAPVRGRRPDAPRATGADRRQPAAPAGGPAPPAHALEPPGSAASVPAPRPADGTLRLSKRMSELGLASRREADTWIARGWVRVDGRVVGELGARVLRRPAHHARPARAPRAGPAGDVLLNKPVGYVSGQAEDGHEPARVLVTRERRWRDDPSDTPFNPAHLRSLVPAGRLDIDSVGLLVLTQDGRVARQLVGADGAIEKEYLVRVAPARGGPPASDALALLNHGLVLDDVPLRPAQVEWLNPDQLRFVLREGRKRQIRRMCEAVGLQVLALKRVRIGAVVLGALPPGQWRYLGAAESFVAGAVSAG